MGQGQVQGSQAKILGTQGHIYAVVPRAELADHSDMQGTFSYFHLLSYASCSLLHFV